MKLRTSTTQRDCLITDTISIDVALVFPPGSAHNSRASINRFNKSIQNNSLLPGEYQLSEEPSTEKMGKNMMIIAWIIALFFLTYVFGMWEENQFNPNTSPQSRQAEGATQVTLVRNRYGHYVVSGGINQRSVTFLVDTGATDVAIPGELEQELGLLRGRAHYVQTANGTTEAFSTVIDSLAVGDIQLRDVPASIVPNMQGKEVLLGMSFLKQVEFTQKGNQLTLRQAY